MNSSILPDDFMKQFSPDPKVQSEMYERVRLEARHNLRTKGYSIIMKHRERPWPKLAAIWLAKKLVEFAL